MLRRKTSDPESSNCLTLCSTDFQQNNRLGHVPYYLIYLTHRIIPFLSTSLPKPALTPLPFEFFVPTSLRLSKVFFGTLSSLTEKVTLSPQRHNTERESCSCLQGSCHLMMTRVASSPFTAFISRYLESNLRAIST